MDLANGQRLRTPRDLQQRFWHLATGLWQLPVGRVPSPGAANRKLAGKQVGLDW